MIRHSSRRILSKMWNRFSHHLSVEWPSFSKLLKDELIRYLVELSNNERASSPSQSRSKLRSGRNAVSSLMPSARGFEVGGVTS